MSKRKREREILHNCMEYLASNYSQIEPVELTNSICELYDRLEPSVHRVITCRRLCIANFFICAIVLFKNFFRR